MTLRVKMPLPLVGVTQFAGVYVYLEWFKAPLA
jgi:hypothetical protein